LEQKRLFENKRTLLDKEDNYNLNMSLTYYWTYNKDIDMNVSFYVENLINSKNLYYVSTGSSGYYPERLKYLEQPTAIGANFQLSF
jgi:hypothetical protein